MCRFLPIFYISFEKSIRSPLIQRIRVFLSTLTLTWRHCLLDFGEANGGSIGKVGIRAKWHIRPPSILDFCSMKLLGLFLLPPGWDGSPSQGYPQHYVRLYPVCTRRCESKLSCPRTQRNDSSQGSNPGRLIQWRVTAPPQADRMQRIFTSRLYHYITFFCY